MDSPERLRFSVEREITLPKKRVHARAQGRKLRLLKRFRPTNFLPGGLLCFQERLHVHLKVRDLE